MKDEAKFLNGEHAEMDNVTMILKMQDLHLREYAWVRLAVKNRQRLCRFANI